MAKVKCWKCDGKKIIPAFGHYAKGKCFACQGTGLCSEEYYKPRFGHEWKFNVSVVNVDYDKVLRDTPVSWGINASFRLWDTRGTRGGNHWKHFHRFHSEEKAHQTLAKILTAFAGKTDLEKVQYLEDSRHWKKFD